jgi:hypothetical protein
VIINIDSKLYNIPDTAKYRSNELI